MCSSKWRRWFSMVNLLANFIELTSLRMHCYDTAIMALYNVRIAFEARLSLTDAFAADDGDRESRSESRTECRLGFRIYWLESGLEFRLEPRSDGDSPSKVSIWNLGITRWNWMLGLITVSTKKMHTIKQKLCGLQWRLEMSVCDEGLWWELSQGRVEISCCQDPIRAIAEIAYHHSLHH